MPTLFDGIDESLCAIYFLLGIYQSLFLAAAHTRLVVFIGGEHIRKRRRHIQLWYLSVVETERDAAVIVGIDDEIGRNLLDVAPLRLTHRGTWFRIEFPNLLLNGFHLFVRQVQCRLYLFPMFLLEFFEIIRNNRMQKGVFGRLVVWSFGRLGLPSLNREGLGVGLSLYLQQQTFLQVSGSDSCRVEVLQNLQRFLNLLFRCIDVMIDSQLVADAVERFPKQSVVIQ